jgi:endonuclease IV
MVESIKKTCKLYPINAIQIFTHGPQSLTKIDNDYSKIQSVSANISMYVHSSYLTNPWNGKAYVIKHTIEQFESSQALNSKGVVLHIPKLEPPQVAKPIKMLADKLNEKKLLTNQRIILEMKAVKNHETQSYESPDKINRLIEALMSENLTSASVGICIDTAHIYAGSANIQTYDEGVKYCKDLKYPEWIVLIHLNGNMYSNTRAGDKHAMPLDMDDKIWGEKKYINSGCRAFIEFAKLRNIDFIVEITHHTEKQIKAFIDKI